MFGVQCNLFAHQLNAQLAKHLVYAVNLIGRKINRLQGVDNFTIGQFTAFLPAPDKILHFVNLRNATPLPLSHAIPPFETDTVLAAVPVV